MIRRNILKFCLVTACSASTRAIACALGSHNKFSELPNQLILSTDPDQSIIEFLNNKYGKDNWEWLGNEFHITTLELAEDTTELPIYIGTQDSKFIGIYSEINIFLQETINVIDGNKLPSNYSPNLYLSDGSRPINDVDLRRAMNKRALSVVHSSKWTLSKITLPFVKTRINVSGEIKKNGVRFFATFKPKDNTKKIGVSISPASTFLFPECEYHYYINGRWPVELKEGQLYEHI